MASFANCRIGNNDLSHFVCKLEINCCDFLPSYTRGKFTFLNLLFKIQRENDGNVFYKTFTI